MDFHFAATQILTEYFFWVHMSRHNGNYRMIAFYWYVLCIGMLLSWHANDVMFLGCQANFGTQKNYATGTIQYLRLTIALKFFLSQYSQILLPLCNLAIPSLAVSCSPTSNRVHFPHISGQKNFHRVLVRIGKVEPEG